MNLSQGRPRKGGMNRWTLVSNPQPVGILESVSDLLGYRMRTGDEAYSFFKCGKVRTSIKRPKVPLLLT